MERPTTDFIIVSRIYARAYTAYRTASSISIKYDNVNKFSSSIDEYN